MGCKGREGCEGRGEEGRGKVREERGCKNERGVRGEGGRGGGQRAAVSALSLHQLPFSPVKLMKACCVDGEPASAVRR